MAYASVTDYFNFADTNVILNGSEINGNVGGNAQAMDENGDVQCETVWGDFNEVSSTYKVINGDVVGDTGKAWPKLGSKDSSSGTAYFVTQVEASTSNTDYPEITITGRTAIGTADNVYTIPTVTVTGSKTAQALGFVKTGSSLINSSSFTASMQTEAIVHDADGDEAAIGFGGGRIEATGELTICTGTPGATADTANGFELAQAVSVSSSNTEYQTATINVWKNIIKDT